MYDYGLYAKDLLHEVQVNLWKKTCLMGQNLWFENMGRMRKNAIMHAHYSIHVDVPGTWNRYTRVHYAHNTIVKFCV